MSQVGEIRGALDGVRAILRFDATGFRHFSPDRAPCLRSFQVLLWVVPLQALTVWLDFIQKPPEHITAGAYAAAQASAYLLSWTVYPLLLVPLSRHFHCQDRFYGYLSAFNWFQLVEFAAMTPILALGSLGWLPPEADFVLWLFATAAMLAYEWFMLRRGLGVENTTAVSLVLMNFLLNLLIYKAAEVVA